MSLKKDATKINNKIKVVESDSDNDNIKEDVNKDIKPKNKSAGRPKREEVFKKERNEVLNKLNKILGITEDNDKFYLWDVDNNTDIQKGILDLKTDVEKYFRCSGWSFYSKKVGEDRKYMSLMRSIYKDFKYELFAKTMIITRNNNKIKTQQYIVIKK
jgi:hypothetical protein